MAEHLTANDSLSLGDSYYVDENYQAAVDAYAAGLAVVRERETLTEFIIRSHRAGAFYRLGRYEEALQDAQTANQLLSLDASADHGSPRSRVTGLKSGESEACLRREGLAAYQLRRYEVALAALEKARSVGRLNHHSQFPYDDWIRKCQEQAQPAESVSRDAPAAAAPPAKKVSAAPKKPSSIPAPSPSRVPAAATSRSAAQKLATPKYQYYQSDKVMTVSILEPHVQQRDLRVDFSSGDSLTVILTKGGVDYTVIAGSLYDEIDTEASRVVIKDEKVLIKLRKRNQFEWYELLGKKEAKKKKAPAAEGGKAEGAATEEPRAAPAAAVPAVDTSKPRPYASHRDWDAIERTVREEEENEKPEGEDAMNKLFAQIYANADDDTKRAMIKSYQTSGGTVLSTNWEEVSKKDYEKERTAPDGMEWKTWDGDKLEGEKK